MRRHTALLLGLPVLLLAACAQGGGPSASTPAQGDGFERHAAAVAAAWRERPGQDAWRNGFVPLQNLTVLPADPGFTEATKQAYLSGWYRTAAALPRDKGGHGAVRFADGKTMNVPLVTPTEAYAALQPQTPPRCPERKAAMPTTTSGPDAPVHKDVPGGCTTLLVTGVTLGTVKLRTSRGEATVPAWLFAVRELKGPIARVAVAPAATGTVPTAGPLPEPYPAGLVGAEDLARVQGATVTYRLRVGACDSNLEPLVYETDDVVVVGGSVVTDTTRACTDQLLYKPVTATLREPLGGRPVIDAQTGQVLSLTVG